MLLKFSQLNKVIIDSIFSSHFQTPPLPVEQELNSKFMTKMEDLLYVEDEEEDLKWSIKYLSTFLL